MILNVNIMNTIYISQGNHDILFHFWEEICFMVVQLLRQTKKYRMLKIKANKYHTIYLTTLRLKFTELH